MPIGSPALLNALIGRRSYYSLHAKTPIPDSKIQSIIGEILHRTPSAFNSQSTRIVLLLKDDHRKFWELTKQILRDRIDEERFQRSRPKLDRFQAGYGTVLFYEDTATISGMKDRFGSYAEYFDVWSEHTSGMHQVLVWTALEAEGFGANLQHYNPVVDEKVAEVFELPTQWRLRAQLVFGMTDGSDAPMKEKRPINEVMKVFGAES